MVFPHNNLLRYNHSLDIARGDIPNMRSITKFGRNPDIDQAGSITAVNLGRTIWDGGIAGAVNWVPPTTARTHQIASSSANDDTDGAGSNDGARTVKISGLDANFLRQNETLTLNGVGDVPTASTYTMIHRMQVLTAGATGWNEGTITATADTDNTITAQITIGNNQTLMAIFQIPANEKGYMTRYNGSLHKTGGASKFADLFLLSMEFGAVWRIRDATDLASDGSTFVSRVFDPPKVFQAKEYIQVAANPSADGQDISAGFDLICVPE